MTRSSVEKLDGTKQTLKVEALLKFKIDAAFLGYLVNPATFDSMFGAAPGERHLDQADRSRATRRSRSQSRS